MLEEESLYYSLGSLNIYHYGIYVAVGVLAALIVFAALCRRRSLPGDVPVLWGVLAIPFGLVCSRLLFCILDFRFHGMFSLRAVASFWGGGFSMMGALLGAVLAALLAARILRVFPRTILDSLSPALFMFIFFARLGEGSTELLGRSRSLDFDASNLLFLNDGYSTYLNTYILEAICALILFVVILVMLRRERRPGDVLLTAMLLFGCTQVLWESLRFDSHMRWSFISMQMGLAAVLFVVPLIIFAVRCGKKAVVIAVILSALVIGGIVGIELMIDRTDVSNVLLYIAYVILLSLPVILGLHWKGKAYRA
ncbi:MAG: prolipoprotein diacylglyceryl transferase [Clostridia bacterium]|nr:prolipoprotein diacylglyceryl transferase [Clostridia bacterium]